MMRRVHVIAAVLVVGLSLAVAEDKPKPLTFGKGDSGKVPAGWTSAKTGTGEGSVWKVVEDASSPSKTGYALAQTAEGPGPLYNICVADSTSFKDGEITVSLKPLKGKIDQGGGIVWRYQDNNNYYIARYNPLEENFRVYKVIEGKRTQLATKEEIKGDAGNWHTLSIRMVGENIECSLDGKKYLEAKDGAITKGGKVGLWTKADAQTNFDNLQIQSSK